MILLPAIDLYEKKCVRLFRGNYQEMTVYSEDPVGVARSIKENGASWLHVVDLEGAKEGTAPNRSVIRDIIETTGLNVETGGGIRSLESIEACLSIGVKRVILGTRALDQAFLKEALSAFGDAIAVGVDAKNGKVATHGWMKVSELDAVEFVQSLKELGVKTVIATDISKDGAMAGTNLEFYRTLKRMGGINIIASGGVSSLEDIKALKEIDVYGAILGKAMYTGAVNVKEAIALLDETE